MFGTRRICAQVIDQLIHPVIHSVIHQGAIKIRLRMPSLE